MSQTDWVSAIEAAYMPAEGHHEWGARLLESTASLFPDAALRGISVLQHDASCSEKALLVNVATSPLFPADAQLMTQVSDRHTIREMYYPPSLVSSTSAIAPKLAPSEQQRLTAYLARYDARDSVGLLLRPGPGVVGVVFAGFGDVRPLAARARRTLAQVALHLETSLRLRLHPETLRAVLTPGGEILHWDEGASNRDTLRLQVQQIERARLRAARTSPAALDLWAALVGGRASLFERVDGGRRLYFVVENAPATEPLRALTRREIDVLTYSARGLTGKLVAYSLGISESAVSTALASAARKIGLSTRLELVRVAAMFARDPRAGFEVTALTGAEREVLELIASGLTNADIARLRGRSIHTIANQIASLLRKTGSASRRALGSLMPDEEPRS